MSNRSLPVSKYNVVGPKGVLINLHPYPTDQITESGIIVPAFDNYETDGGKPATKIKEDVYSPIGQIEQISIAAQKEIDDSGMDLKVGDWILIQGQAKASFNWFVISADTPVANFDGKLLIHPNQILAKLEINNGN